MSMQPLAGRKALITGASRGLGLAVAEQAAAAGADVYLIARDSEALTAAQERISQLRINPEQQILAYAADLADTSQVDMAFAAATSAFGSIDLLVNNAAVQGQIGPLEYADWRLWTQVFQINFFAAARLCQLAFPGMKAAGYGKVVNLSGGGAASPRPDFSAYGAAKAALVRLSETLAEEWRDTGVHINCVAPGAMNTRMLDEVLAAGPARAAHEYTRALSQHQSGGTNPATAAALIIWLLSPVSDGITGRLLSAVWDNWANLSVHREQLATSDIYTLRRIVPADRGQQW